MKLIVSGVPCCGKTFFGDWLRDSQGFAHIDLESLCAFRQLVIGKNLYNGFSHWVGSIARDVVVTWGFLPDADGFNLIKDFQRAGFSAWWFYADFDVARKQCVQRNGEEAVRRDFDAQAQRLRDVKATVDVIYTGRKIETLNVRGYLPVEQTLTHIRTVEQTQMVTRVSS